MKRKGSQVRHLLAESGYTLYRRLSDREVVLQDVETLERELWSLSDDFAGFVIEVDGKGYEFGRAWGPSGWDDEPELLCPRCKGPVWDVAKGHKLNKCWNCMLAFD